MYRDFNNSLEEISLQDELIDFINGKDFGKEKKRVFILRQLRRDNNGDLIPCVCKDELANEGLQDCHYCEGIGYYWDEKIITGFLYDPTKRKINTVLEINKEAGRKDRYEIRFMTDFNVYIHQYDRLFEPDLTVDGFVKIPIKYVNKYIILENIYKRMDYGRLEYNYSVLSRYE